MIVGPEIWDVLDRGPIPFLNEDCGPFPFSNDRRTPYEHRWANVRYQRLLHTITILNQLFTKAKMEIA